MGARPRQSRLKHILAHLGKSNNTRDNLKPFFNITTNTNIIHPINIETY